MLYLFAVVCALALTAFFCGMETAAYSVNRLRLEQAVRGGDARAALLQRVLADMPLCLSTLLIGTNLASSLGTQFFSWFVVEKRVGDPEMLATLVIVPLFFFFGETLPKQAALTRANGFMLSGVRAFYAMQVAFSPLSWLLTRLSRGLTALFRLCGLRSAARQGRAALSESLEGLMLEGRLTPAQLDISNAIIAADDKEVGEIMLSLTEVCKVPENLPAFAAGQLVRARGHRRALLIDGAGRCTGRMLSLNSVLRAPELAGATALACSRPVPALEVGAPVTEALERMRRAGAALALVKGRRGGFVGALSLNRVVGCLVSGVEKKDWNL